MSFSLQLLLDVVLKLSNRFLRKKPEVIEGVFVGQDRRRAAQGERSNKLPAVKLSRPVVPW